MMTTCSTETWRKVTDKSTFLKEVDKQLLRKCKNYYSAISVGMSHPVVKVSQGWPFSHEGSVFGEPREDKENKGEINNRPAIWIILEEMKIDGGAGNNHQHQYKGDCLTRAVYKLIDEEWHYVLHPSVIEKVSDKFGI